MPQTPEPPSNNPDSEHTSEIGSRGHRPGSSRPGEGSHEPRSPGGGGGLDSGALVSGPEPMPRKIGGYLIKHRVDQGGMGVVYAAVREDPAFQQLFALKVLKRGMDTEDIVRRFNQERRVLAALDHPNIARLIDGGTTEDGLPYFVMEFVEGQPIDKYCDAQNYTLEQRLAIFGKVCAAVQAAHSHLIVHRDLKPGNILVTREGEPKLLDFGIAKLLNPMLASEPAVTGPGVRLMTPEYASPEQVRGDPITTSSDVYSLGVLLYELLTGRRPFRLKTRLEDEIRRVICEEDPERPSTAITREAQFPQSDGTTRVVSAEQIAKRRRTKPDALRRRMLGDIDDIILMAMEKSPASRYASADQLAQDIGRHLGGMPVQAHKARGAVYTARKFVKRNRGLVAAVSLIVLSLVVGLGAATYEWRIASEERAVAVKQRDLAQQRFDDLRELAKVIRTDVYSKVRRIANTNDARLVLVATSKKFLDDLEKTAPNDPRLLSDLAEGYQQLGDIQGGLRDQNQGDTDAAQKSYQKALDLREQLAQVSPADVVAQVNLADVTRAVADMDFRRQKFDGALQQYDRAISIVEKAAPSPGGVGALTPDQRFVLYMAIEGRGKCLNGLKEYEKAKEAYERQLALIQDLVKARPEVSMWVRNVDTARGNLCDVLVNLKKYDEALPIAIQGLTARQERAASNPNDDSFARDVPLQQARIAYILKEAGKPEEALKYALPAIETDKQRLAKADPDQSRPWEDLAYVRIYAAQSYEKLGNPAKALEQYQGVREMYQALVTRDPKNPNWQKMLKFAENSCAEQQAAVKKGGG